MTGPSGNPARRAQQEGQQVGALFHGGVPGLQPGDLLVSAAARGADYAYHSPTAVYRRDRVYLTTEREMAEFWAAQYLDDDGRLVPGDVYQAQAIGPLRPDSDFPRYPDTYLSAREARVLRVVARAVKLSEPEHNARLRRQQSWGLDPMYDAQEFMLPSPQMRDAGVTEEYLRLFGPGLMPEHIDGRGQVKDGTGRVTLAALISRTAALDRSHQIIQADVRRGLLPHRQLCWRCHCGVDGTGGHAAVAHQLVAGPTLSPSQRTETLPAAWLCHSLATADVSPYAIEPDLPPYNAARWSVDSPADRRQG